jgi:hypothetical protein
MIQLGYLDSQYNVTACSTTMKINFCNLEKKGNTKEDAAHSFFKNLESAKFNNLK